MPAAALDVLVNNAGIIHLGSRGRGFGRSVPRAAGCERGGTVRTHSCLPPDAASVVRRGHLHQFERGKSASPGVSQFSASQHAVRAFADALRAEVNADGIRVTVVHPGRTATTRQERIYETEARAYQPELLMQPEDVAMVVVAIVSLPRTAEITEISMRPMVKSY